MISIDQKKFLNKVNFKRIFLLFLVSISFAAIDFLTPIDALHPDGKDSVTKSLIFGANTILLRDITNQADQVDGAGNPVATTTYDSSNSGLGTGKITVTDLDANLDTTDIDLVLSSANSTSSGSAKAEVELSETGVDTGTFSGTLFLSSLTTTGDQIEIQNGDDITVNYDHEPLGVGRFSANIDVTSAGGSVTLSDVIPVNSGQFCPDVLVTLPVVVDLADGTTADASTAKITISYANADLGSRTIDTIKMLYKGEGDALFSSLTPRLFPGTPVIALNLTGHDFGGDEDGDGIATSTITNVDAPPQVEGQYALGIENLGCTGVGGGGLVRPGLVVNALAGVGTLSAFFSPGNAGGVPLNGGGGSGFSAPTIYGSTLSSGPDPTFTQLGLGGSSDGIISIQDLDDSTEPISIQTNDPINLTFDLYENQGINNVGHVEIFFFQGDTTGLSNGEIVSKSDTKILFDRAQSVHVTDPHGYFSNAEFDLSQTDAWNLKINYYITFAKPMETTSLLIRTWDLDRNTGDKLLVNAIKVVETSFLDVPTDITSEESFITQTQVVDIPMWVKNNAMWWQQKQIDDSDFVAGIEYLIQQSIIRMPETETTSYVTFDEIPDWIRDVAGFWANDSITDVEFVQSMQWLISKGIMVIV